MKEKKDTIIEKLQKNRKFQRKAIKQKQLQLKKSQTQSHAPLKSLIVTYF